MTQNTITAKGCTTVYGLGELYATMFPKDDFVREHADENGQIDFEELGENIVNGADIIGEFTEDGFEFFSEGWVPEEWRYLIDTVTAMNAKAN